jgi:protein TonB
MDYAQQQRNPAKHLIGFTVVVLLHVVIVYALVNGLARNLVEIAKKPFETQIVKEVKAPPPPEAPPPPPPKLDIPPPPFIPPPEIQIAVPMSTNTISQVTNKAPPPPPAIKPAPRVATAASIDRNTCTAGTEPAYPMASRRNQEAGTLVMRIQIDAGGNPARVEVTRSSGHNRLDEAAKVWVATCRFKPQTVDGAPVAGWATQAYTFNLRD